MKEIVVGLETGSGGPNGGLLIMTLLQNFVCFHYDAKVKESEKTITFYGFDCYSVALQYTNW